MIEIHPRQVVVHHWSQQGKGDLRPFFKQHGLARHTVVVTLIDRKRETITTTSGDAFLFGERLAEDFPVEAYEQKWRRRRIEEPNDGQPAPCSFSNYCWVGIEQRRIPWKVLKSAWRHEDAPHCQNCETPTVLVAFGYFVSGFYKRAPIVVRICTLCRSQFEDHSPWNGPAWMVANLDQPLLPVCELMFGQPGPWTAED